MRQDIRFAVTKKNSFHFVVLGLKHRSSISRAQPGLTGLDTNHGDLSQKCWALEIQEKLSKADEMLSERLREVWMILGGPKF